MKVSFVAIGTPAPQGSMKGAKFQRPDGSEAIALRCDNKNTMPWRYTVAAYALSAMRQEGAVLTDRPVEVIVRFYFRRPKSLPKKVAHKTSAPDTDKLQRAVGDSLSGVLIRDDAQIVHWDAVKLFGEPERAEITVRTMEDQLEL